MSVVVTSIGADYTKLGSFGTAEQFGSNLVASMDMSYLKKRPQALRGGQVIQASTSIFRWCPMCKGSTGDNHSFKDSA